jgi:hypothetical protein
LIRSHYELLLEMLIDAFESLVILLRQKKQKTDFEIKEQGHLVLMTCGHRGRPSR